MYMHKNYGTFRNMPIQIHMHANLLTNNFPPNVVPVHAKYNTVAAFSFYMYKYYLYQL